ncbi:MAG: trigger factor [Anaerolineae bacterium]|nr:trigger factor [Anaerolineae bacterium]
MEVTAERIENCQVELTIEVDEERVEQELQRVARRVSKRRRIPGFRPGKVPYDVVLRYFGKNTLYQEVFEDLGQAVFKEALEKEGIEPFAQAELMDVQFEPMVLKMVVPVAPIVELGDYRQLRLTPPKVIVSDEEVETALESIQAQHGQWQPVERPAQLDDQVIVDIESTVEGEVVLRNQERALLLKAESPYPLPGFNEQILGMVIGQEREFDLTYPETSANEKLAGKESHFKVHLHDLKELVLPELDDGLAKTVGDFETFDDLKAKVRENLQAEAEREAESRFASEVLTATVERARIEFPPVLLERELDSLLEEQDGVLRQREGLTLDNWLEINKKSKEEYRDELRPRAAERLKRGLALGKVVELEGITVEEEEVEAQIERMSLAFGEQADKARDVFSSPDNMRSIASDLLTNKALQRVVAIARGEVEDEIDEVDETAGPEAQASEDEVELPPPAKDEEAVELESAEDSEADPAD